MNDPTHRNDPWARLKTFTDARIGLGRAGPGLPTHEVLKFSLAHARARDAVTTQLVWGPIEEELHGLGFQTHHAQSSAHSRDVYLRRPDLGRELAHGSRRDLSEVSNRLREAGKAVTVAIVVADGLSSKAVTQNTAKFLVALSPHIARNAWTLAPLVLADQARVAFGDEVGEILGAKLVVVLIGERPGLSSPDSLGVYLTFGPRRGCKDADRNCISNVRMGGLSYEEAAFKLAWLMREALRRELTGVNLKDESNFQIEQAGDVRALR